MQIYNNAVQKYNIYIITNVIDVTHLIKAILKQSNTSFKLPNREWNHFIIHIIEEYNFCQNFSKYNIWSGN